MNTVGRDSGIYNSLRELLVRLKGKMRNEERV